MYPIELFLSLKTNENVSGMKKLLLFPICIGFLP